MRQCCAGAVRGRLVCGVAAVAVIAGAVVLPSAGLADPEWSGPTAIDKSNPPQSISCPSSTLCVAVGTNGYAQAFNGSSWGTPRFIDPSLNLSGSGLTSISCPSASFCGTVDQAGYALTFNGGSWTPRIQFDKTGNALTSVSCASASFCVAGDDGGNGFVYNGASWSGPITIDHTSNQESIGGIACPSASFCVAVGEAGSVETSTDGGAAWTSPPEIIGSNDLTSVSCPSTTFCVAVDAGGNAYTYSSGTWSAADPIDTANSEIAGGALFSVSCPSSSFCAAFDGVEDVLMFSGSSWSAPQKLESGGALRPGVSCASSSFCAAVDGGGDAFLYGAASAPPAPTTLPAPLLGKIVDASPVTGVVYVKAPAGKSLDESGDAIAGVGPGAGFVRLTAATQIPIGSEVNSLHGSLKLVTATAKQDKTQGGTFGGGIFKVSQATGGKSKGLVTLSLVEGAFKSAPSYSRCQSKAKTGDASPAAPDNRVLQLLRASAHGKFRTRGRYSAATVLGTIWTVTDRCDGTLTHDITDSVTVTDFVRHMTIILHAGQSYLASTPARGK
jgi:hypothetical protein